MEMNWIPVTKILPEEDNEANHNHNVLLFVTEKEDPNKGGVVCIGKRRKVLWKTTEGGEIHESDWTIWGWDYGREPVVHAWMPLPDNYKIAEG